MPLDGAVAKLQAGSDLTREETGGAVSEILSGVAGEGRIVQFLAGLAAKGETDDELLGMLDIMHKHMVRVRSARTDAVDVCGTGGDGLRTFNVSTAAAFVTAASGCAVAKHGNRSSSGGLGSADIFEYLGYNLDRTSQDISAMLEEFGICFMFAQKFHPAMRHVAPARKKIGKRTAFNILGPLCNPAGVKRQLVGVSSESYLERLPRLLGMRGAESVMTVRSEDGMDELATHTKSRICTLSGGKINTRIIRPESLGLHISSLSEIRVDTTQDAMRAFVSVIDGAANAAMTETVMLNSAAALIVGDMADDFGDGIETAANAIKSGRASGLLEKFVKHTGDAQKLEEVRES